MTALVMVVAAAAAKGVVLVGLAAGSARLLRHHSAAARHAIWAAAVVGHLLLLALAPVAPMWRVALLPAALTTWDAAPPDARTPAVAPPRTVATAASEVEARPAASVANASSVQLTAALVALWALGCAAVLARLVYGTIGVWRLARRAERVGDGRSLALVQQLAARLRIRRPVIVLRGDGLRVPVTWGIVYPVVLLPVDADRWPEARRRLVLVHELAHVVRLDALTLFVAQLALAVFWFDPFLWLAVRRMHVEQERACDDLVLRHGTRASQYVHELVDMIRGAGASTGPAFAALAMARRSEFEGRMLAILDPTVNRAPLSQRGIVRVAALVPLVLAPLASLHPIARAAMPTPIAWQGVASSNWDCDAANGPAGRSAHQHIGVAPASFEYRDSAPGRCLYARFEEGIVFAGDTNIAAVGNRTTALVHELRAGIDRRVVIGPEQTEFTLNGGRAPFDAAARAWLSTVLPEAIRESGVDAAARVDRIARGQGIDAVLAEVGRITIPGTKSIYLQQLIARRDIDAATLTRIVGQAEREIIDASGDLTAVLAAALRRRSDVAGVADDDALVATMRAAARIEQDGDKGRLLIGAAPDYLGSARLRAAYFDAFATMRYDGDRRRVLLALAAVPGAESADVVGDLLRAARAITSDGDLAAVLIDVASRRLITSPALRSAFLATARGVRSEGDYARVLAALQPR